MCRATVLCTRMQTFWDGEEEGNAPVRGLSPGLPHCKEGDASDLGLGGGHAGPGTSRWIQWDRDKETAMQGRGQGGRHAGPWMMQWTCWAMGEEAAAPGWRQGGNALGRRQGDKCGT